MGLFTNFFFPNYALYFFKMCACLDVNVCYVLQEIESRDTSLDDRLLLLVLRALKQAGFPLGIQRETRESVLHQPQRSVKMVRLYDNIFQQADTATYMTPFLSYFCSLKLHALQHKTRIEKCISCLHHKYGLVFLSFSTKYTKMLWGYRMQIFSLKCHDVWSLS